jgi:hypothetical protein
MPKKTAATPETNPGTGDESILVTAAKAIGTAAGKVARLAGAAPDAGAVKSKKIPKLVKKTKSKLPRKEKKAAAAKAARKSAK